MRLPFGADSGRLALIPDFLLAAEGDKPNAKSGGKPAGANTDGFDVSGSKCQHS